MVGKSWINDAFFKPKSDGVYLVVIGRAHNRGSWYRETRVFDGGEWILGSDDEGEVLLWTEIPAMPATLVP